MAGQQMGVSHRGKHEGHYRKRPDGKWEGRITINYEPYSRYGKTKAECQSKIKKLIEEIEKGVTPSTETTSLAEWLDRWLKEEVAVKGKATTVENYENVRKHIPLALNKKRISAITPDDIQKMVDKLRVTKVKLQNPKATKEEKDNAPFLSARTIGLVRHIVRRALNFAIKKKALVYNPAASTTIIMPTKEKTPPPTLSREEVAKIKTAAPEIIKTESMLPYFILLIYTGLRRGEGLGLRWADVDLEKGTFNVANNLVKVKGGKEPTTPKTKAGFRTIPIPPPVIPFMQLQFVRNGHNDLVFSHPDGTPYYPDSMRKMLRRILDKCGVGKVKVHALRHTFATLMLLSDVNPKIVQEMIGHADITTTLGTYSHPNQAAKNSAIEKMLAYMEK